MKTINNIYNEMCSLDNLKEAIQNAAKRKRNRFIKEVVTNLDFYARELLIMLLEETFVPKKYIVQYIHTDTKTRKLMKSPFYPDRCVLHAIAQVMLPRWNQYVGDCTFGSWTGRGINCGDKRFSINHRIKKIINSYPIEVPLFCLKIDIRKCYETVDADVCYEILSRSCRDKKMLHLFRLILDSTNGKGLPIGSYISQLFINIYLTPLDRFIETELHVEYVRYMDDIALFSQDKQYLHQCKWRIQNFLFYTLKQELNSHRLIFEIGRDITQRPLDIVGYKYYRTFTLLRNRIKNNILKKLSKPKSMAAYNGILMGCESGNFQRTYNIDIEEICDSLRKCPKNRTTQN